MTGTLRWVVLALLAPVAALVLAFQVAALLGAWALANLGLAAVTSSSAAIDRAVSGVHASAVVVDTVWSSPLVRVLESNPMGLGVVDDLRESAHAYRVATGALAPLADVADVALGLDGGPKLIRDTGIDLAVLPGLAQPISRLADELDRTGDAMAAVGGDGPLGGAVGALVDRLHRPVADLALAATAVDTAFPSLPDALGAKEPRRYLICALNDAESFGAGGAPLAAAMVEAVRGRISVPVSGQVESKLSPNNPEIRWRHAGGLPWFDAEREYPFVNSNFSPDFPTAAIDMRRSWAALGYPAVDGVITVDVSALARILKWTGGVDSAGYGEVTGDNIFRKVLVDAYRDYDSLEGVEKRHSMNSDLAAALARRLLSPTSLLKTMSGALDSIPGRHIQANFVDKRLQSAVVALAATGGLSEAPGDLVGVFSQSGPNKLSIFQERRIVHEVALTANGGARVRQTVTFRNDVPTDLAGDPSTYRGYLALLARIRVAYRIPAEARDATVELSAGTRELVRPGKVGPYRQGDEAQVLWQGHDIGRGATVTAVITYRLPAGTWSAGRGPAYTLSADPQPLVRPVELQVRVQAAPGAGSLRAGAPRGTALAQSADPSGWRRDGAALVWDGVLDRPIQIALDRG